MFLLRIIQLIIYLEDAPRLNLSLVIGCTVLHGFSLVIIQNNLNVAEVVVVKELTVEVNPIHPIQPLIDLTRFSSFTTVIRIMSKVIEFCQSPANPFEKLVRQEQLLHCT